MNTPALDFPLHLKPLESKIKRLDWASVEALHENLDKTYDLLRRVTVSGKANDPSNKDSHEAWYQVLHYLTSYGPNPAAIPFSLRWFRHLESHDLRMNCFSRNRALPLHVAGMQELSRGNAAAARRWLTLATVEDYRSDWPGAARTVLLERLNEDPSSLSKLHKVVKSAGGASGKLETQAEYILMRWYLSQDIRRSDVSLDEAGEYPLSRRVLKLFITALTGSHASATAQGNELEYLAAYLLSHLAGCFPVKRSVTPDYETDLVVRNLSRHASPALELFGRYFLVECKNWKKPAGTDVLAYLANKVRYSRARFGILLSRSGITGMKAGERKAATFMLHRTFHQDGIVVAVLEQSDLDALEKGKESILRLLLKKHDEVRFGRWAPDKLR